jgi:hypothetical protein
MVVCALSGAAGVLALASSTRVAAVASSAPARKAPNINVLCRIRGIRSACCP